MNKPLTLFVLLGAGCFSKPAPKPVLLAPTQVSFKIDREELERGLETHVLESYQQMSLGNVSSYWESVAEQRNIALLGVLPLDVIIGKKSEDQLLDRRLYRNRSPRLLSKNLDRHVSIDESVGWTYDEVSYRVQNEGREAAIPIRITSILVRDVDRWVTVLEHQSYGVSVDEAKTLAASNDLRSPMRFKSDPGPDNQLTSAVTTLINKSHQGGLELNDISTDEKMKSLVLWPDPSHEFWGEAILDAPSLVNSLGEGIDLRVADIQINLSQSKKLVWVAANLIATQKGSFALGLRGSYLMERQSTKDRWVLMQAHVAIPLKENQLSERIFGAPLVSPN